MNSFLFPLILSKPSLTLIDVDSVIHESSKECESLFITGRITCLVVSTFIHLVKTPKLHRDQSVWINNPAFRH